MRNNMHVHCYEPICLVDPISILEQLWISMEGYYFSYLKMAQLKNKHKLKISQNTSEEGPSWLITWNHTHKSSGNKMQSSHHNIISHKHRRYTSQPNNL